MKRVLLLSCALCASVAAWAAEWRDPETGITWIYEIEGISEFEDPSQMGVIGLIGSAIGNSGEIVIKDWKSNSSGEVNIPSEIDGRPVTKIADGAFSGNGGTNRDNIESVVIPSGVTYIGREAFSFCKKLRSVTIPEGVVKIGTYAFYNCSLDSVELPSTLESVEPPAFEGQGVFGGTSLTVYAVDEAGISKLFENGNFSFDVIIPEGTTAIADGAFSRCHSLSSVSIPSSVTSIGERAFYNCSRLTSVTIPSEVSHIGAHAFLDCEAIRSITIPSSVKSIGEEAFANCHNLESITLSDGVEKIGKYAFANCPKVKELSIPNSVVLKEAFIDGRSVKFTVYSPETLKALMALYANPNPANFILKQGGEKKSTTSGETASNSFILKEPKTGALLVFELNADQKSVALKYVSSSRASIIIPNTARGLPVTTIRCCAFLGCPEVQSISLPPLITLVSNLAFQDCTKLNPNGVTIRPIQKGDIARELGIERGYNNGLSYSWDKEKLLQTGFEKIAQKNQLRSLILQAQVCSLRDGLSFDEVKASLNALVKAVAALNAEDYEDANLLGIAEFIYQKIVVRYPDIIAQMRQETDLLATLDRLFVDYHAQVQRQKEKLERQAREREERERARELREMTIEIIRAGGMDKWMEQQWTIE